MRLNPVYSAVLREPWAIDPLAAEAYLPLVLQMMENSTTAKEDSESEKKEEKPLVRAVAVIGALSSSDRVFTSSFSSYDEAPTGSIAIHTVDGPMMTEDYCGAPGTATIGVLIQEADDHENIAAHLVHWKTPGGTVSGTERFSGIITDTKKPLVSYAEQMCSAGYWSGSGANLIVAAGKTAMVGSIGTMCTITDFSGWYEKIGIKSHTIRATDSKDKNEPYLQALQGKYELMQKQQLDPLNAAFTSSVKDNRGEKLDLKEENVLTGKVYIGQTIVDCGLADELGSFEYAVQRAAELARAETGNPKSTNNPNSNNSMGIFSKKPVAAATAFASVAALAGKKGEELTAEMLDAANDELEAAGIEGAALITVEQHDAFQASVENEAKLTQQLEQANDKIAKLEKKPSEASTTPSKANGETPEPAAGDENAKIMADLPHNKAIANNPLFNK
ncbi:S49 family peptidase [Rufibacter roseus]|uniref:S49 family peptidase n=1 Tax=Rufibacter roseus TaxID=1567108 RepID=A0ABW2DPJ3_9BACT|nr:S49 family peptidase [Rufibacter roseus]